jgi:HlyD family secretion protein
VVVDQVVAVEVGQAPGDARGLALFIAGGGAAAGGGRGQGGFTSGVVYVLRDDKPVAVPVRVGASDGSFTQIVGDIKVGDQVITGGGPKPKAKAAVGGPMGGGQPRARM